MAEWFSISRNEVRRSLRRAFGPLGDKLRDIGWNSIKLGDLTKGSYHGLMVKLAQALYYKHLQVPLEGIAVVNVLDGLTMHKCETELERFLSHTPLIATISRGGQSVADQFIYRFNASDDYGVIYAVVRFSEQIMCSVMAIRADTAKTLPAMAAERLNAKMPNGIVQVRLTGRGLST